MNAKKSIFKELIKSAKLVINMIFVTFITVLMLLMLQGIVLKSFLLLWGGIAVLGIVIFNVLIEMINYKYL